MSSVLNERSSTDGAFGVSSAGYWWGRGGALLLRLLHYLTPGPFALWALLYADDGLVAGHGAQCEAALLFHLFLLEVLGTPLKWRKVRGGTEVEWIGYFLDLGRFTMGISVSRANWCVRWLRDKARERRAPLGELREGLGRLVFATGPLEHLRPLLGPLFAWAAAGGRHTRPLMPPMLLIILGFLADQLEESRTSCCRDPMSDLGEVFRLDAKAAGDEVAVGGWISRGGGDARRRAGSRCS